MARVTTTEALRFMTDCLKAVGASAKAAQQQAELLIEADRVGHPSHGLNRLELYVNDIVSGYCKPNNQPMVLKENASTAWVDANQVLGATASHFAMDIAIKKAKSTGVGWVTVKGSNHNGMAGYWAKKAANEGLIGMAFTNTSPLLAPTRSKKAALGTNPLSVVAPGTDGETFYLDMATTAVAVGKEICPLNYKGTAEYRPPVVVWREGLEFRPALPEYALIEMQMRKGETLPNGWAQGPDGNQTTDATLAFNTGCLMPLGGAENTSGYKGFGLSAMVELFCGISAGSNYGHHIRSWSHTPDGPANLGHCFVAVDPESFAPGFGDRVTDCIRHWRNLEPTDNSLSVLAPGDKEMKAAQLCDSLGTVSYVKQQIDSSEALAKKLKIEPMTVILN